MQTSRLVRTFATKLEWKLLKNGYRWMLVPKFRPIAPLDTSLWSFNGGFCTYAISTKITCACPYTCKVLYMQNDLFYVLVVLNILFLCINSINSVILVLLLFKPYPANIFVMKMSSAFNICCIYSSALQTRFYHPNKVNEHYEPWSTAPLEQSDLDTYCLQYRQERKRADDRSRDWRERVNIL